MELTYVFMDGYSKAASVLSVPVYTTTYGMLVNEDLFAKENIAIPKTYEELLAACEAFQKAGYKNPIMGYNKGSDLLYPMFYPYFCKQVQGIEKALSDMNEMKSGAGEYRRDTLELVADFMSHGYVDLEACNELKDNYDAVILRFFEGDVPMMLASGNTVSGTEKRMVTPCIDMSLDSVYAPFGEQAADRFINITEMGLADSASSQVSKAGWQVSNGLMTVDEAIKAFGSIE
ncbi:MAG: extracellular solute-binding protein [Acetatifactor sp.]|nr:extracellular solute-binding protein [Acetatifactor sp.]